MGFFGVLNNIRANRDNFKKWEKEEADNDARRQELYKNNKMTEEELAQKKKLAETIIDTISVMDQKSEDVAEDVETVTQPIVSMSMTLSGLAAFLLGSAYGKKKFRERGAKLDVIRKQINQEQLEQIRELNISEGKNKRFNTNEVFSPKKNKKSIQIPKELESLVAKIRREYAAVTKSYKKYVVGIPVGIVATAIGGFVASVLYTTKLQVGSSRIARFQAREDLENPKNFVMYTDEQIEHAKKEIQNKPEKKKGFWAKLTNKEDGEKTGLISSVGNLKDLAVNKSRYDKWKAKNDKRDPRIKRTLTPEELQEAKNDKVVIQRLTKKVNNKAEEYSENMETAATVIIGSSLLGGPILGGSVGWILNKLGLGDKLARKVIAKYADEDTAKIYDEILKLDPKVEANKFKIKELKSELRQAIEMSGEGPEDKVRRFTGIIDDAQAELKLAKENNNSERVKELTQKIDRKLAALNNINPIAMPDKEIKELRRFQKGSVKSEMIDGVKKFAAHVSSTKLGRSMAIAGITGMLTTVIGAYIALKLQKQAGRAGRFAAKQDFKENPQEFINYSEEELNSVKHITAPEKTRTQRFKEYMSFLPRVFKQYREYRAYKKGEFKQEKALREELINLEVTPEQLREGKNLQRKLFNTFEKIDDKSQEYSENMEAATDISQQLLWMGNYAAIMAPIIGTSLAVASGKITGPQLGIRVADFLSRFSFIAKSKFFQKYVTQVSEKIEETVQSQVIRNYGNNEESHLAQTLKDMTGGEKGKKLQSFVNHASEPLLVMLQEGINKHLPKLRGAIEKADKKSLESLIKKLQALPEVDSKTITEALKGKTLADLSDSKLIGDLLNSVGLKGKFTEAEIKVYTDVVSKAKALIPKEVESLLASPIPLSKSTIETLNKAVGGFKTSEVEKISSELEVFLSHQKDAVQLMKTLERVNKNIPVGVINDAVKKILDIAIKEPQKFAKMLENPQEFKNILMTKNLSMLLLASGISWGVFTTAVTFAIQSYFAKLQIEAGRLGVMKAMDELSDPTIYADETPKEIQAGGESRYIPSAQPNASIAGNIQNLLKK